MRPELMQPFCGRCGRLCDEGWLPAPELDPPRRCVECAQEKQGPQVSLTRLVALGLTGLAIGTTAVPILALLAWVESSLHASGAWGLQDYLAMRRTLDGYELILMWVIITPFAAYLWEASFAMHRQATQESGRPVRLAAHRLRRPGLGLPWGETSGRAVVSHPLHPPPRSDIVRGVGETRCPPRPPPPSISAPSST